MFRCRPEPLGLALALASVSASAQAEPLPAHVFLDYAREESARTCLAPEQLVDAVEARLGRNVFVDAPQADMVAEVRARRAGGRFVVDVGLFDRDHGPLGQRQLSTAARHCSALDDSLALVLALAADVPRPGSGAEARPTAPGTAPVSAARDTPAPRTTPIVIAATTHAPRLGLRLEPSLGVALLVGPLPGVAVGGELGVTVRAGNFWPVSLRASGWWPETARVGAERGARFSARSLELGVCPWEGLLGGLSLQGCVLEWFGRVEARGFGFDADQHSEHWLLALGAGASVGHWFGPAFVSAHAALLVPPVRRRYFFTDVTQDTTLHDEPWLFGAFGARLGTEF